MADRRRSPVAPIGAFFNTEILAKAVMTPEQEGTVRSGFCPKCVRGTVGAPIECEGIQFRQCRLCATVYVIGAKEDQRG